MNPLQVVDLSPEDASGLAQGVLLLTTIAGFLFQAYRENRNHRWDEERRLRIAAELQAQVEATALTLRQEAAAVAFAVKEQVEVEALSVKQQVEAEALAVKQQVEAAALAVEAKVEATEATVKRQADAHAVQVARALRENTAITQQAVTEAQNAYSQANNFTRRLQQALQSLDTVKTDAAAVATEKVDRIQEVVEDNNEQIRTARAELEKLAKEAQE